MSPVEVAKFNMIEQQIRPWEVLDHVILNTLESLNRDEFVCDKYKGLAYADCQVPIKGKVKMFPPTIEGRMLQALTIAEEDNVLEVGSGSGYITACLTRLGAKVTSIDIDAEMIELAQQNLAAFGNTNVSFEQLNAFELDRPAEFDVIAVCGSVVSVPENLRQALRVGGRMFIICGQSPVMQALLITRVNEAEWTSQSLFETDLPALNF